MIRQSLNGIWTLEIPGSKFPETKASVPGSVYHDLLTAGLMPDPFWRDHEDEALKIMEHDFIYSRTFAADADLLNCDAVNLALPSGVGSPIIFNSQEDSLQNNTPFRKIPSSTMRAIRSITIPSAIQSFRVVFSTRRRVRPSPP